MPEESWSSADRLVAITGQPLGPTGTIVFDEEVFTWFIGAVIRVWRIDSTQKYEDSTAPF